MIKDIIEAKYGCLDLTIEDVDLFVMLGTSLMNGYSTAFNTASAATIAKYFPSGDQTFCRRFGTTAPLYEVRDSYQGLWPYMNIVDNYQASTNKFGPDATMAYTLYNEMNWPNPIYIFHYERNGTVIIEGEAVPSWSANETSGTFDDMIDDLLQAVSIIKRMNRNPRISVMWGSSSLNEINETKYRDEFLDIMDRIRTELEDDTINFLLIKFATSGVASLIAFNQGIDLAVAIDALSDSFYAKVAIELGVSYHPTTMATIEEGMILASYWYEKYGYGNRPVVSNLQIVGTMQVGSVISFTWTFSGGTQDTTVSSDTWRQLGGTRIEIWTANDNIGDGDNFGTNEGYLISKGYGETYTLTVSQTTKYIKIKVFGRSISGARYALPVESTWFGPVIA